MTARDHPLWTIWLVAVVVRAAYTLARPDPFVLPGDSADFERAALDLLAGRGLLPNEIGIIRPPLYPLLVAVCYALGGIAALQLTQVLLTSITPVLIALLARSLQPTGTSLWAPGLSAAVYPWFVQYVPGLASENIFTLLAVASFVLVLHATARKAQTTFLSGVAFAGGALARANLLITAPGLGLWLLWRTRSVFTALVFTSGVLLGLAPFTLYNWSQGNGVAVATAAGAGLNFYLGNNPEVTKLYSDDLSDEEWRALNVGMGPVARTFLGCHPDELCANELPIHQRDAFYYSAALRYIRSNPEAWLLTQSRKLAHYWRPWVEPRAYPLAVVAISGLSFSLVLGLALLGLRTMSGSSRLFVVTVAATSTVAVVLTVVQLRYRFALLDPVLLAAGGAPMTSLLFRVRSWILGLRSAESRHITRGPEPTPDSPP